MKQALFKILETKDKFTGELHELHIKQNGNDGVMYYLVKQWVEHGEDPIVREDIISVNEFLTLVELDEFDEIIKAQVVEAILEGYDLLREELIEQLNVISGKEFI